MADAREELMASIRAGLAGESGEPVRQALEFYEEYIAESLEAGRSADETLARLGGVSEIVAQIRAEATLARAESTPGPFRMIGAGRQVFRGIAGSAARSSLIVAASVPYTVTLCFYLLALCSILAAAASAVLAGYGITTMPAIYLREKVSVAGAAVFATSIMVGLGSLLWSIANGISRVTLRVLRKGLRRNPPADAVAERRPRSRKTGTTLLVCAIAAIIGVGALFSSGLPMKVFSIWDSQKPVNLSMRSWSFSPAEVREVEIGTLNTAIVLEVSKAGNAVRVTYEEPQWLAGNAEGRGGKLVFRESSSGMVPFMDLIARHPGTTTVRVEAPPGYVARSLALTSGSGSISVAVPAQRIQAHSQTGRIVFAPGGVPYSVRASAPGGGVFVRGAAQQGGRYEAGSGGNVAELSSDQGTIDIH